MDTEDKLKAWLKTMGYDGKIPKSLRGICNPCTAVVWEEIIGRVKPKQDVEFVRNNIIIQRLNKKHDALANSFVNQAEFVYPVKEIELWAKRQTLDKKIKQLEEEIFENEKILSNLIVQNKAKYVNLENLKQKIREQEQFTYLLKARSSTLENEIVRVDDMLTQARNLTPIESTDESNKAEITATLTECSEKLQKMIELQTSQLALTTTTANLSASRSLVNLQNTCDATLHTPLKKIQKSLFSTTMKRPTHKFSTIKKNSVSKWNQMSSFSVSKKKSPNMSFSASHLNFSTQHLNSVISCDLLILNDEKLNEAMEGLLYNNNRSLIWKVFNEINERSTEEFADAIVKSMKHTDEPNVAKKELLMSQLYATHIDNVLKMLAHQTNVKNLENKIKKQHNKIRVVVSSHAGLDSRADEIMHMIKLRQEEEGVKAAIILLRDELKMMRERVKDTGELRMAQQNVRKLEDMIEHRLSSIVVKMNTFKHIQSSITDACVTVRKIVRKLNQFTDSLDWTLPLTDKLLTNEIDAFLNFPLEYNRTIRGSGSNAYNRDVPSSSLPYQENCDSNTVNMLIQVLQSPHSPAECLFYELIRMKNKIKELKAMKYVAQDLPTSKYTLEDLQKQESYIVYTIEKLNAQMHSEVTKSTLNIATKIKEMVELWREMPLHNFVSPERLFNGQPYQHYKKLYESIYIQL